MISYSITPNNITVVLNGNEIHTVTRNAKTEEAVREAVNDDDEEAIRAIVSPAQQITEALDGSGVEIRGGSIFYRGHRIANHLEQRILQILNARLDIDPWRRFVERIYSNPSKMSRDEFALFMERADLPITEDGCFLAYKRVKDDYTDTFSGTYLNYVGNVVEMPRSQVDDDAARTCSSGLHFCSQHYLRWYLSGRGRIMILKVDPADVVSIPVDHEYTKGRTWRYTVVGEVDTNDEEQAELWGIINNDYSDYDEEWEDDEGDDYWGGWDDDDEDVEEGPVLVQYNVFNEAPPEATSWWRGAINKFRKDK